MYPLRMLVTNIYCRKGIDSCNVYLYIVPMDAKFVGKGGAFSLFSSFG